MTKIDIISGFLGAGKTTLIKKLIKEAFQNEKLVLIENEFGEIGIDGGFLKDSGIQVTEMNSGCICCSLVGDFGTALKEVLNTYHPDRIIIEPSGVGKLSDVIKAVENITEHDVVLNSYVTVSDVKKCKMYMKNFGEFYNNQIQYAKTIILSRTDDVPYEKLDQSIQKMRELNSSAVIITTPWKDLDGRMILEEMEKQESIEHKVFDEEICDVCGHIHAGHLHEEHDHEGHHHEGHEHDSHSHEGHHHEGHEHDSHSHEGHHHDEHEHSSHSHEGHHHEAHSHGSDSAEHHHEHGESCSCGHDHSGHDHSSHGHHHADEVFSSWGKETHHRYTKEELENILETLTETDEYGIVLRAKGMLPDKEGKWMYFDMVPGEYEIREGQPMVTGRICVIGSSINEKKLSDLFFE